MHREVEAVSTINTEHLQKCIDTLKRSIDCLNQSQKDSIEYEMFRNSLVKSFEITLEQSGKLLKKKLMPYFASKKAIDQLTFKDIFRYANKHGLLDEEAVERWFSYRENRNSTAHDYGIAFAEETLKLAGGLVIDARKLRGMIDDA